MLKVCSSILISLLFMLISWVANAASTKEILAANFLAYKDVIESKEDASDYNLNQNITRREMAKVTLKLSQTNVGAACKWEFLDLSSSDWGCKYAEAWKVKGFFASNENFNPNDNISKIEALKMIMKGRWMSRENTDDWREGYVNAAVKSGLIEQKFIDYNASATRWWIFIIGQHAVEYSNDTEIQIIEELLWI